MKQARAWSLTAAVPAMIRAFLFSSGWFVALCGSLLLFVDRVVLTTYATERLHRHRAVAVPTAKDDPPAPVTAGVTLAPPLPPEILTPESLTPEDVWQPRFQIASLDDANRVPVTPAVAVRGGVPVAASSHSAAIEDARPLQDASPRHEVFDPPDWAAFGLLSMGGVMLLYSLALPGRHDEDDWRHRRRGSWWHRHDRRYDEHYDDYRRRGWW